MIGPDDDAKLWDELAAELDDDARERVSHALRGAPALQMEHALRSRLISELRSTLGADEPSALLPKQHAELERHMAERDRKPARTLLWALVACALLCLLPAAAYYGWVLPEQQRLAQEQQASERLAQVRAQEAQRLQQEESAKKLKLAQEQAMQAVRAAEEAKRMYDLGTNALMRSGSGGRAERSRPVKPGKASRAAASGACDPNDALCGL